MFRKLSLKQLYSVDGTHPYLYAENRSKSCNLKSYYVKSMIQVYTVCIYAFYLRKPNKAASLSCIMCCMSPIKPSMYY